MSSTVEDIHPCQLLEPISDQLFTDGILIVLGSGLSRVFPDNEVETIGTYSSVMTDGHPCLLSRWESSRTSSKKIWLAQGRRHRYEGCSLHHIGGVIEAFANRGVKSLILTSSVGGLNPGLSVGDLILHSGYVTSFMPLNKGGVTFGRNVPGEAIYPVPTPNRGLNLSIIEDALREGIEVKEGVYAGVIGPSYETRAEIRALRKLGGDVVGMSVLPEIEIAHRNRMSVVAMSILTNILSDSYRQTLSHDEVTQTSFLYGEKVKDLLEVIIENFRR